jgi:hypothetical protein
MLCACDGVMNIRGETPPNTPCLISLVDKASGNVANTLNVSGPFRESLIFPAAWRAPQMTLRVQCQDQTVKVVENPGFGEVNLGNLKP